jgi:hypothetical protein
MAKKKKYTKKEAPEIEVIESDTEFTNIVSDEVIEEPVIEEPVIEEVVEEPKEEKKGFFGSLFSKEEKEEEPVVESTPSAPPRAEYQAWWSEVGNRMKRKGYSKNGIIKRAKAAYGKGFDEKKFNDYCEKNEIYDFLDKVEAVWTSQN